MIIIKKHRRIFIVNMIFINKKKLLFIIPPYMVDKIKKCHVIHYRSSYIRGYILYASQEGKGWINLLEGKSVPLVAKCSANRHSSPFSASSDSGIRVDLAGGTRCALQFRALIRSMRDRYGTPSSLRIASSLNTCVAFRRRNRKRGKKVREKEKLPRGNGRNIVQSRTIFHYGQ